MPAPYRNREFAVDLAHPPQSGRVLVKLTPSCQIPQSISNVTEVRTELAMKHCKCGSLVQSVDLLQHLPEMEASKGDLEKREKGTVTFSRRLSENRTVTDAPKSRGI